MLKKLFRSLHEHPDPAQRVLGVAALAPDAPQLAQLLGADPAPEVRAAAAGRCGDLAALTAAWHSETDASVRPALAAALATVLAQTPDSAAAQSVLAGSQCSDAIRAAVAHQAPDEQRRRCAIESIGDEDVLVDLAVSAALAPARMAAAERVHTAAALRRLGAAALEKDRGVARLARQRLEAIEQREEQSSQADAILAQLEALAGQRGPILTAALELDRRFKALDLTAEPERRARWEALTQALQLRCEREHALQRARVQFERRLAEWQATPQEPPRGDALRELREALSALREQAQQGDDDATLSRLERAEPQIAQWEQAQPALARAEALVGEAEQLAAGTPIDDAQLPQRWQGLDLASRTPALTKRFEAALLVIEQRRLAYLRGAKDREHTARQRLHAQLAAGEQALGAGELQTARAAADHAAALKGAAGLLPKPTLQRLGRLMQQLVEMERWQSFGQQSARLQLCERAEALASATGDLAQLARDVQALRTEWKALDQQHAAVPRTLWERFDQACERAYAPAARHFAELSAQRKHARQQRDHFIAEAQAQVPALLAEPRDWRAIERWLRETDLKWRSGELGSVDGPTWKKLDSRLKAGLAPLRDALAQARAQAVAARAALIEQAQAIAAQPLERDAPERARALQAQWKEIASAVPLAQRDERRQWEQFHAACDTVFQARQRQRSEAGRRRHEQHQAFDGLCGELEQLAHATDKDDGELRRAQRALQAKWHEALRQPAGSAAPTPALEARLRRANAAIDALLRTRARTRESAVWQALLAKEQLCAELDALVLEARGDAQAATAVQQRWQLQPALSDASEKKLAARRDAALRALADEDARFDHVERIERDTQQRGDLLLELELLLGLDSPADLQARRRVVQVKQLRDRFKGEAAAASGNAAAGERLLAWCTLPGVADTRDRQRCERIVATLARH